MLTLVIDSQMHKLFLQIITENIGKTWLSIIRGKQ